MNTRVKLVAFLLALVALTGVGAAVGNVVGPIDTGSPTEPVHSTGDHP